jgi:acyl carrier protein
MHAETVRALARDQGRLADDGNRLLLDSMGVIEFTMAIEDATGIEIRNADLTEENFRTVDDVARLLERLSVR